MCHFGSQLFSDRASPFENQAQHVTEFHEGECIELGGVERIMCSMRMAGSKSMRYLLIHDYWLVLAKPDLAAPGCGIVTLLWPLWQVETLVDGSDPCTLQLTLRCRHVSGRGGCD